MSLDLCRMFCAATNCRDLGATLPAMPRSSASRISCSWHPRPTRTIAMPGKCRRRVKTSSTAFVSWTIWRRRGRLRSRGRDLGADRRPVSQASIGPPEQILPHLAQRLTVQQPVALGVGPQSDRVGQQRSDPLPLSHQHSDRRSLSRLESGPGRGHLPFRFTPLFFADVRAPAGGASKRSATGNFRGPGADVRTSPRAPWKSSTSFTTPRPILR